MSLLHQRFEARAFWPGSGWTDGQVTITSLGLRFEGSETVVDIPLPDLVAEVREGDENVLVFTSPKSPGLEIVCGHLDLLDCPVAPLAGARDRWVEMISRRELKRRLRLLVWVLVAGVMLTVIGTVLVGSMVRSLAARVPPAWDASIGAAALEAMRKEGGTADRSNDVARLVEVASPLLAVLPPMTNGYQFHLVENEEPNAFALPGGHIVIHTGLLQLLETPEEFLGVMAHEVAHVTERHMYRKVISTAGPLMICRLFLGRGHGLGDLVGGGAALMVGAGFSQEYETEADRAGWDYLLAANVDPRGMISVFRKLQRQEEQSVGADATPAAFHSHPALGKRIRRLESRWARNGRQQGFVTLTPLPEIQR